MWALPVIPVCSAVWHWWLLDCSSGNGLHAAFLSQSQLARQSAQTDIQYFTLRHTHLHHRSTWVWWAAAWQRCTLFSPPHTTPQRLPWLPSLWSACPWMHTETKTERDREKMSRLSHSVSGSRDQEIPQGGGPQSQQQNEEFILCYWIWCKCPWWSDIVGYTLLSYGLIPLSVIWLSIYCGPGTCQ